jgi:hypothetical protein
MCMQCASGAAVAATAGATGLRAWIGARKPSWATPGRMKLVTGGLITAAVLVAGIQV